MESVEPSWNVECALSRNTAELLRIGWSTQTLSNKVYRAQSVKALYKRISKIKIRMNRDGWSSIILILEEK